MKPDLLDRYTAAEGRVYLTGIHALVRLPLEQMRLDAAAGLHTATYISGYEGSPLGGYDFALHRAAALLESHRIHFQPGLNEDLAASAIWGAQMLPLLGPAKVDGVVGIWYGKGPGVDRSGDALRHANLSGTGPHSAAICLAGDDHACKSSTIPHQSDFSFYNLGIPFFAPGHPKEILEYGLHAIAMSRWSGAWVGLKLVTNVCDGGGTVDLELPQIVLPEGFTKHSDGRMVPPHSHALEVEVNHRRLLAVAEYARANRVNTILGARHTARLGILTTGKSYYDLVQAFTDCGIDPAQVGIRVGKVGLVFPLERTFIEEFAQGLETIFVLEEKRSFLELQLRELLYSGSTRPVIVGKQDERGEMLVPPYGEMDPERIVRALGRIVDDDGIRRRMAYLDRVEAPPASTPVRKAIYCSGCPHNRSTILFDGQVAGGGIGCHGIGVLLTEAQRGFLYAGHMGAEGAHWMGLAPFTQREHIFQNIGDGTLAHSGQLAINACVAAGVNITFKLLYNAVVAMTGGQKAEGALSIPALAQRFAAEGVKRIVILSEAPELYHSVTLPECSAVRPREALEATTRELEQVKGVTILIYDQECAAEKRRLRSRGKRAEPTRRLMINPEVCEGCGDCVRQSNCVSLHPIETPLGQKMTIHQSSCNKDYTCALGDCPSFIRVHLKPGTGLRKPHPSALDVAAIPEPTAPIAIPGTGYRILSPGIGGTGVVTVNAVLAQAAQLDGLAVLTLDQTGLSQKGGAVTSHLLISQDPIEASNRIHTGACDLLLAFDIAGAAAPENFHTLDPSRTVAIVNSTETPTSESIRAGLVTFGGSELAARIATRTVKGRSVFLDAGALAEELLGTHLAVNFFLTGFAWQAGLIPITRASIEMAIALNGVAVDANIQAFHWGRQYFHDAPSFRKEPPAQLIDYEARLLDYQNAAYAGEFRAYMDKVRNAAPQLASVVERNLYKLMAIKDEYEVARLLTSGAHAAAEPWQQIEKIEYLLHPPLLRSLGLKRKIAIGALPLRLLAALKPLRGTPLDPFGYTEHRKLERSLIPWYRGLIDRVLASGYTAEAEAIAALPERIRGYDAIKERSIAAAKLEAEQLLAAVLTS